MSSRFYLPEFGHSSEPVEGKYFEIAGSEVKHISSVMRLEVGSEIAIFDGSGKEYASVITEVSRKKVVVKALNAIEVNRESQVRVHIAAALPKSERQRFLIEKLTELGVETFTPLLTQRSVAKATSANLEKFRRYVIEACKQCGRNVLMKIGTAQKLQDFAAACEANDGMKMLAHPSAADVHQWAFVSQEEARVNFCVIVGPEGGLTELEVEAAVARGFTPTSLGSRILRTETACVAIAAVLSAIGQRA